MFDSWLGFEIKLICLLRKTLAVQSIDENCLMK